MVSRHLGGLDKIEGRGLCYFAGRCECGRKKYLSQEEAQKFVDTVYCLRHRPARILIDKFKMRFPKIRLEWDPKGGIGSRELLPIEPPKKKEKRVNIDNFDKQYSDFGGSGWVRSHAGSKLKDIAAHFGFSVEYARRVKNGI